MNALALFLLQGDFSTGDSAAADGLGIGLTIVWLAVAILMIAAMWKIFQKAGQPGWAALIPIYNLVVLLQVAGKPVWWIVLMLIPIVNFVVFVIVLISLAQNFGKGTGFAFGLMFLPPVFYPMLAWGDAQYQPATA
ncbi:MAG TPA: DUF5684 domain-containing protein [Thermoanaerobaculia bacterium]|nr:DUF5684 domain-containing protein [Thermoanaerobaculia bacterium]